MKKKLVMLLLCISMTCTALTGCGDKKDSDTKTTQSAKETQSADSENEETEEPEATTSVESTEPTSSTKSDVKKTSAPKASKASDANTKTTNSPAPTKKVAMTKFMARIENSCDKITMKELYVSSYGEGAWGENLLAKPLAYDKSTKRIAVKMPVDQQRWDIKVITDKGKKVVFRELDVSECDTANITITLMYDDEGNPIAIAV